jgi:hypothetical protein
MSNFRTKLLGLAAVATAFTGASFAQNIGPGAAVGNGAANLSLRSEGQTELVGDYVASFTTTGAATVGTVYATLTLPVTSKALTTPATAPAGNVSNSDAVLQVTNGGGTTTYYGTVSGSQISFNAVTLPLGAFTLTTQNVRVNASAGAGGAPQVSESLLVSYAVTGTTTSNATGPSESVGYILTSLGPTTIAAAGIQPYFVCTGNVYSNAPAAALGTASFSVGFKELFGGAFKTAGSAATGGEGGSFTPTSVPLAAPAGVGTAATATQLLLTLANVPSAATVYLPQSVTSNGTTLTLSGSTAVTSPTSLSGANGPDVAYTPSNGGVTATYTVTANNPGFGPTSFSVPVYVGFAANSAAAQGAITALVTYTPAAAAITGPAATIPTFAISALTAANGASISTCQTSLLFPFVTNQLGFDTGIVLANTSTDNLGAGGKSAATAQSGTCTLSFYGSTAPSPATGVADPQGSAASGTTHAFLLSSVAPGFQGYAIASCPFLYGHGFAFIEYNLTQPNGVVEGYLAEVIGARPVAGQNSESLSF